MFPMVESMIVLIVVPGLVAGTAIGVAKAEWNISGWGTVGVGIGGWVVGFILGALVSTAIHELFKPSE